MDSNVWQDLYAAAPTSAIRRALSEPKFDPGSYAIVQEHADRLTFDELLAAIRKPFAEDVEPRPARLVSRLAEEIVSAFGSAPIGETPPSTGVLAAVRSLELSDSVDADAWLQLTTTLRGRIPAFIWYFFVDRVRGGRIFGALNSPPSGLHPRDVLGPVARARPEPVVVPLLDHSNDDLQKGPAYVLSLHANQILRVHGLLPDLVKLEDVRSVMPGKVADDREPWVPPFPEWMAELVAARIWRCGDDDEAVALYRWLAAQPSGLTGVDEYDLAFARSRQAPSKPLWHALMGKHLATGRAWKTRALPMVEWFVDNGKGFPIAIVDAALAATNETDGADPEKHRDAILRAAHDVTARVFVARTEAALRAGEWDRARLFLNALTSLEPGSFIAQPLHFLSTKIENVPADLVRQINACKDLAHASGRAPSKELLNEAYLVLTGQVQ